MNADVRLVHCGFGGVGPLLPPGMINAWVVALVLVSAHDEALAGVTVATVVLLGDDGAILARAIAPIDGRAAASTRSHFDLSPAGTSPFSGDLERGTSVLLRVHAPLDTRAEVLYAKASPATRVRIAISAGDGVPRVLEGAASQWPTA